MRAHREEGFPATVVPPLSHLRQDPLPVPRRLHDDRPDATGNRGHLHGDGTSLWTLTHHADFARGFVGLLGNPGAIGEAIHITSDEALT